MNTYRIPTLWWVAADFLWAPAVRRGVNIVLRTLRALSFAARKPTWQLDTQRRNISNVVALLPYSGVQFVCRVFYVLRLDLNIVYIYIYMNDGSVTNRDVSTRSHIAATIIICVIGLSAIVGFRAATVPKNNFIRSNMVLFDAHTVHTTHTPSNITYTHTRNNQYAQNTQKRIHPWRLYGITPKRSNMSINAKYLR